MRLLLMLVGYVALALASVYGKPGKLEQHRMLIQSSCEEMTDSILAIGINFGADYM